MLAAASVVSAKRKDVPELNRMVAQKATTVVEGAFAAQMEIVK
jgi:hypothetical protein